MKVAMGGSGWSEGSPSSSCMSHQWLLTQRSLSTRAGSSAQMAVELQ